MFKHLVNAPYVLNVLVPSDIFFFKSILVETRQVNLLLWKMIIPFILNPILLDLSSTMNS